MAINVRETDCCCVDEISEINNKTPKQVIQEFCLHLGWYDHYMEYQPPAGLVTFTGVVGLNEKKAREEGDVIKGPFDYGQKLAKFIKDNKLGTVVAGPARFNRVNHPSHKVRLWVWAPSEKGLKDWFYKNNPKVKRKVAYRDNNDDVYGYGW